MEESNVKLYMYEIILMYRLDVFEYDALPSSVTEFYMSE